MNVNLMCGVIYIYIYIYMCVCVHMQCTVCQTSGRYQCRLEQHQETGVWLGQKRPPNERAAKWKAAGNKFTGVCYNNIYNASDYQQAGNVAEMVTMTVMCARYGKEAMLADVNPYYVLGSVCVCG